MIEQEPWGGKFLPAFFVEPVALGEEFEPGKLPLHMTFFPPVAAEFKPMYAHKLREHINPMRPFLATVADKESLFGNTRDIPVRELVHTPELFTLHRKIVSVLQYMPHSARYRTPYNPHISIAHNDPRVQPGDTMEVGGFSIVEKGPRSNVWRVMAKVGLKGGDLLHDLRFTQLPEDI